MNIKRLWLNLLSWYWNLRHEYARNRQAERLAMRRIMLIEWRSDMAGFNGPRAQFMAERIGKLHYVHHVDSIYEAASKAWEAQAVRS